MEQLKSAGDTEENQEQQRRLAREIMTTENSLKDLEKQYRTSIPALESFSAKTAEISQKTKALSAVAGGLAVALVGNAYKASQTADELNTLSRNTGLSVEELQKMQFASDRIDVSVDQMTSSIVKLTKGMSSGSKAFETLGINITDADGNLRDATDVWYETLEALSKVENETQKDALAMELFGKSAMDLSGIIDDGGEALKTFGQEAEDAGLIISGDTLKSANEFNDAIDKLKVTASQAFLEVGASLATELAPALETIVEKVADLLSWFSDLDGTTQTVILTVLALIASISPVAGMISSITTIVTALTGAITALSAPVLLTIGFFGALVVAGIALYKNWDKVKEVATETYNVVSEKFTAMKEAVTGAINRIKEVLSGFSWKLPDIKLPHFKITGGEAPYGFMGKGSFPSIDVEWYRKAYTNAMLFKDPTVLATPYGLKGFGDGSGSELVIGTDTLMNMISASNGSKNGELGRITSLLEVIASNGMTVTLQGDARQMFKVVRNENTKFKGSTGKSAFNY